MADYLGGRTSQALPTLDQGQTNRCVAYAAAQVVWARLAYVGARPSLLNIRAMYVAAQRWEQNRRGRRAPLQDVGLHPVDMVQMLSVWGAGSIEGPHSPELAPARVNEDLFIDEYMAASKHAVCGWRRIPEGAEGTVEQAKRMLSAGFPGMDGIDLDERFYDTEGRVYTRDPHLPSRGRHMTVTIGFDDNVGDGGAFLKLNQWGGNFGFFWVSYETYASRFVGDRTFLDVESI